ncbi:hypothetical protein MTR_2g037700 [Medicago truncatula]|uniref:Uncharacterized protein n=1 Tax=Medicago truncatula TaxID=3880 RepID=Q2HUN1_MEDTR|nr:hypothetical protein MtrDRAFT_AC149130g26v2 [Medicago truncatula]AES65291.1 hypothetical protein MTR_2g037700 [Medicago truncatula]
MKMFLRQLTTEVRNRLQLTTEETSAVNCRRKKEKKRGTHQISIRIALSSMLHISNTSPFSSAASRPRINEKQEFPYFWQ